MYVNVCSDHTGCGNRFMGKVHTWQNFYFDGHMRYRKSKDITRTALIYLFTRAYEPVPSSLMTKETLRFGRKRV